jgi:hypothetical protein
MLSLHDAVTILESERDNPAHEEGQSTHKKKHYPRKTLGIAMENVSRFCPTKIGDHGRELGQRMGHSDRRFCRDGTGVCTGVRILALCPGAAKTEMNVFSHNEGLLGKLPSLSAEDIVRTALRALEGKRVVKMVGWLNGLLVFLNRCMPRATVRGMMGVIAKPPSHPAALL